MAAARLKQYIPNIDWLFNYRRDDLSGDVVAGLIVAIMLVPQGMAYALLAGLPPEAGLYASILPLLLYSLFGSSRVLAVGPVAIVSLMVAAVAGDLAEIGAPQYAAIALILAFMSGAFLLVMGLVRLGFLVNFMSHPVISGFTSAAALVIGFSQLKHLLGTPIPRSHHVHEILFAAAQRLADINPTTLLIGLGSIGILLFCAGPLERILKSRKVGSTTVNVLTKSGPLFAVMLFTTLVWAFRLDTTQDVRIIGHIPVGLPPLTPIPWDGKLWWDLLPAAFLISVVGFIESVSVAKSLASKRRQRIDANRELVGLGAANVGAAFSGGYPVTGGFSRSVVNFTAGANTPLSSVCTAALVLLTVLILTPLFYYLPNAVLGSVIIVAVFQLLDIKTLRHTWRYNRADAVALLMTFIAVLTVGVELGIVFGIIASLLMYLWRTSRPHVAIVGRVGNTEHFRNIDRHDVRTCEHVLTMRIDESLYFANTRFLEDTVLRYVSENPELEHVVLICSAINFIDASALETLYDLIAELRDGKVVLHLSEVKGPVEDRLRRTDFLDELKPGKIFLSTDEAMRALNCV